jgi:hypothetical protein
MKRTTRGLIGALLSLSLLGALAGSAAAADAAWVRVVHASPDAPNVDVWVDGDRVLTDVPFTAVSDYLELAAGTYNVQVTATGDTAPVIDADLTLEAGTAYTVAATGLLADIAPVVLVDDTATLADQAKLRIFHASPSAPASVDIAVAGGPILVDGLAYPEASGYLAVDPGDYEVEIRAAGEMDAALTVPATLEAGTNVTAIAMDGGDAGVQVIVAVDARMLSDTAMSAPTGGIPVATLGLLLVATGLLLGVARFARVSARAR